MKQVAIGRKNCSWGASVPGNRPFRTPPHSSWCDCRCTYKRFVDAGLNEVSEKTPNPLAPAVDGWILGSEAFVKRVQTVCLAGGTQDRPQTPEEVIAVVDGVFGT